MRSKALYVVLVLVLAAVAVGAFYLIKSKGGIGSLFSAVPSEPAVSNEYVSEFYLGKMPIGKVIGPDGFPTKTSVFTLGVDQFCTMMTLMKPLAAGHAAIAIYDTVLGRDFSPKTSFPMELKQGGTGGCENVSEPAGMYEYRFYIDDVLVSALPFEVR